MISYLKSVILLTAGIMITILDLQGSLNSLTEALDATPTTLVAPLPLHALNSLIPLPSAFFETFAANTPSTERPNWGQLLHTTLLPTSTDRAQLALAMGVRITDDFVALEAQDDQQVKNISYDIMTLAKALGIAESMLAHTNSMNDFIEKQQWPAAKDELDATVHAIQKTFAHQKDEELITLMLTGAWIRELQLTTQILLQPLVQEPQAFLETNTKTLLQHRQVIQLLIQGLNHLQGPLKQDKKCLLVRQGLHEIQALLNLPEPSTLTKTQVQALQSVTDRIIASTGLISNASFR